MPEPTWAICCVGSRYVAFACRRVVFFFFLKKILSRLVKEGFWFLERAASKPPRWLGQGTERRYHIWQATCVLHTTQNWLVRTILEYLTATIAKWPWKDRALVRHFNDGRARMSPPHAGNFKVVMSEALILSYRSALKR